MSTLNRTRLQAVVATVGVLVLTSFGAAFAASGHAWHAPSTPTAASDSATDDPSQDPSVDPSEDPGDDPSDDPSDSTDPSDDPSDSTDPSDDPSDSTDPTDPTDPSDVAGTETDPNVAALHGLCRAYVVGNKAEHGHALSSPPFVALETAAGGADQVEPYCAGLFQADATDGSTDAPTDAPTDGPTMDSAAPASEWTHPAHPTHPTHPVHPAGGQGKPTGHVSHGHGSHGRGHHH